MVQISETAFITACNRANEPDISLDTYAQMWVTPKVKELTREYLNKVSLLEDVLISLRHRFFLDSVTKLFKEDKIDSLVNLGAGFTMYPHLLGESLLCTEVDLNHVVEFKDKKVSELHGKRDFLHYLSCDFNQDLPGFFLKELKSIHKDEKPFFLIEGLSYYLDKNKFEKLILHIGEEYPGCRIGLVTWDPSVVDNRIFKKYLKFMRQDHSLHLDYNFLTKSDLNQYGLVVDFETDYVGLSRDYGLSKQKEIKSEEDIFPEKIFLLSF